MATTRMIGALVVAVLVAGCSGGSPKKPSSSASRPAASVAAAPTPSQCATWHCVSAQSVTMPGGFTVNLWHSGAVGDFTTRPVISLSKGGTTVQWMVLSDGYGWTGQLTCSSAGANPTCVLVDGEGAHSALAQEMILRNGQLERIPAVTADSGTALAEDLDDDGDLDVIVLDSDFTPNYATGHLFWRTYRFDGTALISTGCQPAATAKEAPPTQFVRGPCVRR